MRAIIFNGTAAEFTADLEVRAPGPKEVKVKMVAAGLCHSDVSVINGTIPWPAPSVLGHEGAGIVSEVGSAVTSVVPGDHIVISTLAACGVCRQCASGRPTRCRKSIGNASQPFTLHGTPCTNFAGTSAFAEETLITELQAVRIPKDVPLTSAALVGCGVITGAGAVFNRANVQPGDTAIVFGVGGVGLNTIQALRIKRAGRIIAIDTMASKEALARQFGATDFINASEVEDVVAKVHELVPYTDGVPVGGFNSGGVDWAFDVVGHPKVTSQCLDCLDWGGTVVILGVPAPGTEMNLSYSRLTHVDRTVMGTRAGSYVPQRDLVGIVEMYRRGEYMLDELVTAQYQLEDFDRAVHDMHEGKLARGVLTF